MPYSISRPIDSPEKAVRASIVYDLKGEKKG